MKGKLTLSKNNKMLTGVCGGFGEYFGIDPTIIRIFTILLILIFNVYAIIIYILCWAVIPNQQ